MIKKPEKPKKIKPNPIPPPDYAPPAPKTSYLPPETTELLIDRLSSEFIVDYNLRQAAERAGIRFSTAYHLFEWNTKCKQLIAEKSGNLAKAANATAARVLEEAMCLAFANMGDYIKISEDGRSFELALHDLTRDHTAAIQEVEIIPGKHGSRSKFKLSNKKDALELIGRHLKMWTDKTELVNADGTAVTAPSLVVNFVGPKESE